MKILDTLKELEESVVFKDWKKENKKDYLVNFFKFVQANEDSPWQIGYYNEKTDMITTFNVDDEITINPPSEVFKKEGIVEAILLSDVKIDQDKVLEIAKNFKEENYKYESSVKIVLLLQRKDGIQVYNLTFITESLKTLNMRISSLDGSILSHKLTSLMDFRQKED